MLAVLISLLVCLTVWTPYLGSWAPQVYGFPFGAVARDLLLGGIIAYFYYRLIYERNYSENLIRVAGLFLCFAGFVAVLILNADDKAQAITGAQSFILFPAIFMSIMYLMRGNGTSSLRHKIEHVVIVNAAVVAVIAIGDVLTNGELKLHLGYDPQYAGTKMQLITQYNNLTRANGGFGDALNVGYFLAIGVLVSLSLLFRERNNRVFLLVYGAIALACSVGAVISLTRGAILCALIAWVAYFFSTAHTWAFRLKFFGFLTLVISYLFVGPYSETLLGRFTDMDPGSRGSTQGRIIMTYKSLEYLSAHPNGVGLGTQGSGSRFSEIDQRINTDNYWFMSALEMGIFGFALNLIFIGALWWLALSNTTDRRFTISLILMYVVASMLSSAPTAALYAVTFWILLASAAQRGKYIVT